MHDYTDSHLWTVVACTCVVTSRQAAGLRPLLFLHFVLTYSFTNHFFLFWFTTLLIHNSFSFTLGLKPTSFTNPTPIVSLLPPGLPLRTAARTVSFDLLGFVFSFSLFFISVPCARLSWPSRQLLSSRKSTVSFPIVSLLVQKSHSLSDVYACRLCIQQSFILRFCSVATIKLFYVIGWLVFGWNNIAVDYILMDPKERLRVSIDYLPKRPPR